MDIKGIVGVLAVALTLYGYVPYLRGIFNGTTKPHSFTWIIWSLMTGIACAAQFTEGAGAGAWSTAMATILTFLITVLALRNPQKYITRSDWIMFLCGLAAIPVWIATSNALWAVTIATLIEIVGCVPTFRKSWHKPYDEVAFTYGLNTFRHALSITAIASMTITTVFYPAGMVLMNGGLWVLLLVRRRFVPA